MNYLHLVIILGVKLQLFGYLFCRTIYGDQCAIEIALEPLNNMQNHLDGLLRVTINTSNVLAVFLSLCLCCLWNSIAFIFVRESRSGFAHIQRMAGARIWTYWLVNGIYDCLIIACMTLLTTLTIFMCQIHLDISLRIYGKILKFTPCHVMTGFISWNIFYNTLTPLNIPSYNNCPTTVSIVI